MNYVVNQLNNTLAQALQSATQKRDYDGTNAYDRMKASQGGNNDKTAQSLGGN